MTKWDEFLKAEEGVRKGLGDDLARTKPKAPPEAENELAPEADRATHAPPYGTVKGKGGEQTVSLDAPVAHYLIAYSFGSIGVTVDDARRQLAEQGIIMFNGPKEGTVTFKRIGLSPTEGLSKASLSKASLTKALETFWAGEE